MVTATAMALGLPTVAIDCAEHQQLIEHGRNGFLFRNMNEALTLLSQLIDQPALRERIGQEARQRAAMRWSRQAQQHALLRTYSRG
jgi:glycosyltransferase involved in cell wall biosynthesis